jgi:hypothetical protein
MEPEGERQRHLQEWTPGSVPMRQINHQPQQPMDASPKGEGTSAAWLPSLEHLEEVPPPALGTRLTLVVQAEVGL